MENPTFVNCSNFVLIQLHHILGQDKLYLTPHARWHLSQRLGLDDISLMWRRCYNAWIYGKEKECYSEGPFLDYLYRRDWINLHSYGGERILKVYGDSLYVFADQGDYVAIVSVILIPECYFTEDPVLENDWINFCHETGQFADVPELFSLKEEH